MQTVIEQLDLTERPSLGSPTREVVLKVEWTRVGGGLVSPQVFAKGGDKPRLYAFLSAFAAAQPYCRTTGTSIEAPITRDHADYV